MKLHFGKILTVFLISGLISISSLGFKLSAQQDFQAEAVLKITPASGSLATLFVFDGSESSNSFGERSGLQYRFNFDINAADFTPWSSQSRKTYTYKTPGRKSVILEVRDKEGRADRAISELNVSEIGRFSAFFEANPRQGTTFTQFEFKASILTSSDVSSEDFKVRFDYDGDSNYDTDYSKQRIFYHTYNEGGFYLPRMKVLSSGGEEIEVIGYRTEGTTPGEILVSNDSGRPEAQLSITPLTGIMETQFTFDAANSFDREDGRDLQYRFDFESDGRFDTDFLNHAIWRHSYSAAGIKKVTVEVRDHDGNTDQASGTILVKDRDFPPTIDLQFSVPATLKNKERGVVGVEFSFRIIAKDIEDRGNQLVYRYDFDGDGKFETPYSKKADFKYSYGTSGMKTVIGQVRDSKGQDVSISKKILVVENTPPVVVMAPTILNGIISTKFRFDVSKSYDDQFNSQTLEYRWDFNNDGLFDNKFERRSSMDHIFSSPGIKIITVQVRDPLGLTAIATREVEVLENSRPQAFFTVSPDEGTYNTRFNFDASQSFDGQTEKKRLKFRWDFDYNGDNDIQADSSFTTSPKRSYSFRRVGTYTIKLEVQDENGEIATDFDEISIHWAAPFMEFLRTKGYMRGYKNGEMKPEQLITRAEFTTLLVKAKRVTGVRIDKNLKFSDVKTRDWFYRTVLTAAQIGMVSGYSDGSFRPNEAISRAEAVNILMKAFPSKVGHVREAQKFPDVPGGVWYEEAVDEAVVAGIVSGYADGSFRPNAALKRGEAAKMLAITLQTALGN